MKGKILSLKIVLTLLIALTASWCFMFTSTPKAVKEVRAVSTKVTLNEKEYSMLAKGDVIFSVEKVAVNANEDSFGYPNSILDGTTFIGGHDDKISANRTYEFEDLSDGSSSKTVVDNGTFVIMDNIKTVNGGITSFAMPNNSSRQEAVLVSFGSYVYNPSTERVEIAGEDSSITAGITHLKVSLTKDGVAQNLPLVRSVGEVTTGIYFDFVYLITQQDNNSNEGYYKFDLEYYVDGAIQRASFEFYIVNNSSYTQSVDSSVGYNTKPTLGWTNGLDEENKFTKDPDTDGYVKYYIGKNGVSDESTSFPTITYDYTKYNLSYTHTANQKNTTYDYLTVLDNSRASIVCSVTSSSESKTIPYEMNAYHKTNTSNLVTIMLTEPGTYEINYEYVYRGYISGEMPNLGFKTETLKLSIHGLSAYYSKLGYEGAKLQHFEISAPATNCVDLIIPNGYELNSNITSQQNQKLSFAYTLNTSSLLREGDIVIDNSLNSLKNEQLLTEKTVADDSDYVYLTNNIESVKDVTAVADETIKTNIGRVLDKITYVQTNQGSVWIEGNDKYLESAEGVVGSFYYYNATNKVNLTSMSATDDNETPETDDDTTYSTHKDFKNTTSFNQKGFYLVFVKVGDYWQIFAFEYTSSSVNINIEAIDNMGTDNTDDDVRTIVAGGKYTNKEVEISWKKPGIFDRAIAGYYYIIKNQTGVTKENLLASAKNSLVASEQLIDGDECFVTRLGDLSMVPNNEFAKILIRLESDGESATHKMFTIDRESISGIQPYLIEERTAGTLTYYAYSIRNNSKVAISNSVTNGYATIEWQNKRSDAEITATYSYTPFTIKSASDIATIAGVNNKIWMPTNYELGKTIEGSTLTKARSLYDVSSDSVLFNQGIYIITIKDEAGNECKYAFVIDRTPNYFQIGGEIATNGSLIFGDDVEFNVGDYKVIKLDLTGANNDLKELITRASSSTAEDRQQGKSLYDFDGYYNGTNNNINNMQNLFQKQIVQGNNEYYFTIKNNSVVGYNDKIFDKYYNVPKGTLQYAEDTNKGYYKRTIYVLGENSEYSNYDITDNSYMTITINKDNARGTVYYSSTKVTESSLESSGVDTLDYGSNIHGAEATSAQHIAFTWKLGIGTIFEIDSVTYNYYTFNSKEFSDENFFYINNSAEPIVLYSKGNFSAINNAQALADNRGLVSFNGDDVSKEGLYVITRTYKDIDDPTAWGDDEKEKHYYFIVDRNGIIQNGVGDKIKIEFMEGDAKYNNFTSQSSNKGPQNNILGQYSIYLTTTKVPATFDVPTGKYFIDENKTSAKYDAGQLNIEVYFVNSKNSVQSMTYNHIEKIYDSVQLKNLALLTNNANLYQEKDGYFVVDIYSYLQATGKTDLINLLTEKTTEFNVDRREWMFLPGDYVIKITDNVVDELGNAHSKVIGMQIQGVDAPNVDVYTGFTQEASSMIELKELSTNYTATVSQEFLEVRLPNYQTGDYLNALLDPNYLIVMQSYDGNPEEMYINHPYSALNGISLVDNNKYVTQQDGYASVWLNTKLRVDENDPTSEIDYANLNKSLVYKITVRYKLNYNSDDNTRYINCYQYYDTTYTITIDRQAPSKNIDALNSADNLVEEYNTKFETESMIESDAHQTSSNLYFTKQYAKYYEDDKNDSTYIYAYNVYETTTFNKDDVQTIYYYTIGSTITELKEYSLSLPLIDTSKYSVIMAEDIEPFYSSLPLVDNVYYEIIEQDAAGNTTQYVILYNPDVANIQIPMTYVLTNSKTEEVDITMDGNPAEYVFEISQNGETTVGTDIFFKIELLNSESAEPILSMVTSATTDFANLTKTIVDKFTGYGSFYLNISSKHSTVSVNINLYDKDKVWPIYVEDMVEVLPDGSYYINFHKPNKFDEESGIWYFATEIFIKYSTEELTFVGIIEDGQVNYYQLKNDVIDTEKTVPGLNCLPDTTYYIVMKNILKQPDPHRFNTSGHLFDELSFKDVNNNGDNNCFVVPGEGVETYYYGYTDATFKYDTTVYSPERIQILYRRPNSNYEDITQRISQTSSGIYNSILFEAFFDEVAQQGRVDEYQIKLYYGQDVEPEKIYVITIDTVLSAVSLRDGATGAKQNIIKPFNNVNYAQAQSDQKTAGYMVLNWNEVEENSYFKYEYRLYEVIKNPDDEIDISLYRKYKLENGVYVETQDASGEVGLLLNGQTSTFIRTKDDSLGLYKFEIKVFSQDDKYLGNRIYAFEVQQEDSEVVTVRREDGSTFKDEEISSFKVDDLTSLKGQITSTLPNLKTHIDIPLYISNQSVKVIESNGVDKAVYPIVTANETTPYDFTIYKISKESSFEFYIGVLIVKAPESASLVESVKINATKVYDVGNITDFTIAEEKGTQITILITTKIINDPLQLANHISINAYYDGEKIETYPLVSGKEMSNYIQYEYIIYGNGQFEYELVDKAGNVHVFADGNSMFEVYVLREVVVLLDGEVPVNNAFYNNEVALSLYASNRYMTGSISVSAERNGEKYIPSGYNPFVFKDFGSYKVKVSAKYNDLTLTKIVMFTIVNVNEARKSIDLTNLNGYTITQVLNAQGVDVTSAFKNLMQQKTATGGLNISYEDVIAYENNISNTEKLGVSSGKLTFSVAYSVEDKIYSQRNMNFSFTLNNENPTLKCSLKTGEKTTKNFSVYFNPAILFEQVGDSVVYINDEAVAVIDANSSNSEMKIVKSFKKDGDGDYYIRLVSSSGTILESYKVTIKEPLNFWAIVVIIVVVGVVGTVVTTIIVLRRKMRIR